MYIIVNSIWLLLCIISSHIVLISDKLCMFSNPNPNSNPTLHTAARLNRGTIIGRALFYSVCQTFNHAAKHTNHIDRGLNSHPRIRDSLSKWPYLPNTQTKIITIKIILTALSWHPVQDISLLLNNIRSQCAHLIISRDINEDRDRDNPQSLLMHATHYFTRNLNTPFS